MEILSFVAGFVIVLGIGVLARLLVGLRLNLYLLNREQLWSFKEGVPSREAVEQSIIPITAEAKKTSLLRTITKRKWVEDVDITLLDDQGRSYTYRIGFHPWFRFHVVLKQAQDADTAVNGLKLKAGRVHPLRTGDVLKVGDRQFAILVTPSPMSPELHRELYEPVR